MFPRKKKKDNGFYNIENAINNTDSVITNLNNTLLCVMTADCAPILIYEKKSGVIAAIHSGWKGCVKNITLKTILEIKKKNRLDNFEGFHIFIGPTICSRCYEVSHEFIKNIETNYPDFLKFVVSKNDENKYFFDLKKSITTSILNIGIPPSNIIDSNFCSLENNDLFYSYRQNKNCGRGVSFIKIQDLD